MTALTLGGGQPNVFQSIQGSVATSECWCLSQISTTHVGGFLTSPAQPDCSDIHHHYVPPVGSAGRHGNVRKMQLTLLLFWIIKLRGRFNHFSLFSSVSAKGGPGLHGAPHLYHSVPLLPPRSWPVLQFLPLSQTGNTLAACTFLQETHNGFYLRSHSNVT